MRQAALTAMCALLSACVASVESPHPLFSPGAASLKPGMWAMMPVDKPCERPATTDIFSWPRCAAPLLIRDNVATYMIPFPVRIGFIVADGTPFILQGNADALGVLNDPENKRPPSPDRRFYFSFSPDAGPPYTSGRLHLLTCAKVVEDTSVPLHGQASAKADPPSLPPGLSLISEGGERRCVASTPEAVRALAAQREGSTEEVLRLVWVGP